MTAPDASPQIASARPEMAAAIMAGTELDEVVLRDLVHGFYSKVRRDLVLGPIFAAVSSIGDRIWSGWLPSETSCWHGPPGRLLCPTN